MPEQLSLPGLGPSGQRDFLFFALLLEDSETSRIVELRRQLCRECRLEGRQVIRPSHLHVSLHGFREYDGLPRALVQMAMTAGASISVQPFVIEFDRAMSFRRNTRERPFVLRAARNPGTLVALHKILGEAIRRAGWRDVNASFTPHMTLLYDRRLVAEREVEPVQIQARSFFLVHSLRGRGVYRHLARWPLQDERS